MASTSGSLNLSGFSINDLTGIEYLQSITSLDLSSNSIEDISPIGTLTNLITLDLSNNLITSIIPLFSLFSLSILTLYGNPFSDISPLFSLSNLSMLCLSNGVDLHIDLILSETPSEVESYFSSIYSSTNISSWQLIPNSQCSCVDPECSSLLNNEVFDDRTDSLECMWFSSRDNQGRCQIIQDESLRNSLCGSDGCFLSLPDLRMITTISESSLIYSLKGIEYATNLDSISLITPYISDYTPLLFLPSISSLQITDNLAYLDNSFSTEYYNIWSHTPTTLSLSSIITSECVSDPLIETGFVCNNFGALECRLGYVYDSSTSSCKKDTTSVCYGKALENKMCVLQTDGTIEFECRAGWDPSTNCVTSRCPSDDQGRECGPGGTCNTNTWQCECDSLSIFSPEKKLCIYYHGNDYETYIPDIHMRAILCYIYANSTPFLCDLSVDDIKSIPNSDLSSSPFFEQGLFSIEGIQHLSNMTSLPLSGNRISNISPLKGMCGQDFSLVNLTIDENLANPNNYIIDLSPIGGINFDTLSLSALELEVYDPFPLFRSRSFNTLKMDGLNICHDSNSFAFSDWTDNFWDLTNNFCIEPQCPMDPASCANDGNSNCPTTLINNMVYNPYLWGENSIGGVECAFGTKQTDSGLCRILHDENLSDYIFGDISSITLSQLKDLRELTSITFGGSGGSAADGYFHIPDNLVTSLEGIEFFQNLEEIDISNQSISNVEPLALIPTLTSIKCSNNSITDMSPLTSLPLVYLEPAYNNLDLFSEEMLALFTDLFPDVEFSGLSIPLEQKIPAICDGIDDKIGEYKVCVGQPSDVNPSSIIECQHGYYQNGMEEISATLGVGECLLDEYNICSNCGPLKKCVKYNFSDVYPYCMCRNGKFGNQCQYEVDIPDDWMRIALCYHRYSRAGLCNISLNELQSVSNDSLSAANSHITLLDGIEHLTSLNSIDLSLNSITDIKPMQYLEGISYLILSNNGISDLSPLSNYYHLISIDISTNYVFDLSPLYKNIELEELFFSGGVTSLFGNPICYSESNTEIISFLMGIFPNLTTSSSELTSMLGSVDTSGICPSDVSIRMTQNEVLDPISLEAKCAWFSVKHGYRCNAIHDYIVRRELCRLYYDDNSIEDCFMEVPEIRLVQGNLDLSPYSSEISTLHGLELATALSGLILDGYNFNESVTSEHDYLVIRILSRSYVYNTSQISGLSLSLANCNISSISNLFDYTSHSRLVSLSLARNSLRTVHNLFNFLDENNPIYSALAFLDISENIIFGALPFGLFESLRNRFQLLDSDSLNISPQSIESYQLSIPDPVMRREICSFVRGEEFPGSLCDISQTEMMNFTSSTTFAIDSSSETLYDLEGIQYLTNITVLILSGHKITDLSPLVELSILEELNLSSNLISDISPLSSLESLSVLDLSYNYIHHIYQLGVIYGLSNLNISHNPIFDISPLFHLSFVVFEFDGIKLCFSDSLEDFEEYIDDIFFDLSDSTGYSSYSLDCDLTTSSYPSLSSNELYNPYLVDSSGNVGAIECISIALDTAGTCEIIPDTELKDAVKDQGTISEITPATLRSSSLTTLNCDGLGISSLKGIQYLTSLENLVFSNNSIKNIKPLRFLMNLSNINLSDNSDIVDIYPIQHLPNVSSLDISNTSVCMNTSIAETLREWFPDASITVSEDIDSNLNDNSYWVVQSLLQLCVFGYYSDNSSVCVYHRACELCSTSQSCTLGDNSYPTCQCDDHYGPNCEYQTNIPDPWLRIKICEVLEGSSGFCDATSTAMSNYDDPLILEESHISNLEGLSLFNSISSISLGGNHVTSLDGLSALSGQLISINVSDNVLAEISIIREFEYLENFDCSNSGSSSFSNNRINDISPLSELVNLASVNIEGNNVYDISPLAHMVWLERFSIQNNKICFSESLDEMQAYFGGSGILGQLFPAVLISDRQNSSTQQCDIASSNSEPCTGSSCPSLLKNEVYDSFYRVKRCSHVTGVDGYGDDIDGKCHVIHDESLNTYLLSTLSSYYSGIPAYSDADYVINISDLRLLYGHIKILDTFIENIEGLEFATNISALTFNVNHSIRTGDSDRVGNVRVIQLLSRKINIEADETSNLRVGYQSGLEIIAFSTCDLTDATFDMAELFPFPTRISQFGTRFNSDLTENSLIFNPDIFPDIICLDLTGTSISSLDFISNYKSQLKKIYLSSCDNIEHFDVLTEFEQLTSIALDHTQFTDIGILVRSLSANILASIDLSYNYLGIMGFSAAGANCSLTDLPSLSVLRLENVIVIQQNSDEMSLSSDHVENLLISTSITSFTTLSLDQYC
ncbi:hypothetical protein ADUPG1_008467 [Aduncisulcus paluster]|uniref:Chaoptin n=1 Tax=Aduncisulcus paluster TaxID=2918883 RepID=A0ABQ5KS34_9EUKA|nr:hypothetical protein ADUPG1_008467 [Aduncisulcus paluster]